MEQASRTSLGGVRDVSQHQLSAKFSKCKFGCTSLAYLEHHILGDGIAVEVGKIQAVQNWSLPSSMWQPQGFLQLAGYYCHFVTNHAHLAAPLTKLLKKHAFVWTLAATSAFESLKQALTTTPVLRLPRFDRPFEIQTDASEIGIGAVLLQE